MSRELRGGEQTVNAYAAHLSRDYRCKFKSGAMTVLIFTRYVDWKNN